MVIELATIASSTPVVHKLEHEHCSLTNYSQDFGSQPTSPQRPLELVAPYLDKATTRLLDFGCGDGVVSLKLADKVSHFTGTDISPEMVAAASHRGLADVRVLDGHSLLDHIQEREGTGAYDVLFSNLALHWMSRDPERVLRGIHSALKAGGVFVAQFVGYMSNMELSLAISLAMLKRGYAQRQWGGFYLPDVDEYKDLLEQNGFTVDVMESRLEPLVLVNGVDSFFDTFIRRQLEMLTEQEKEDVLVELRENLRLFCYRNGKWRSTSNYITFRAFKNTD
ncbi:S-adenosyl-L-methionine-dependent methyltransferase [Ramicandelaber brevisporus]|nr:S-adenosyl-L-methionine-dependent methyltransferase [Ramicandelaber brevisporus]